MRKKSAFWARWSIVRMDGMHVGNFESVLKWKVKNVRFDAVICCLFVCVFFFYLRSSSVCVCLHHQSRNKTVPTPHPVTQTTTSPGQ